MSREQKASIVASLKDAFAQSNASFLVNYSGLTVEQLQDLRKGLRSSGARMKVAKARLMKLAANDIPDAEILSPYFKEQIGVVFASEEAPAVAKVLADFAKNNEAFSIVVGSFEHKLLDQETIKRIASLPSREIMLAILCGTLKAPISGLARALSAVQKKLEQEGATQS